MRRGTGRAIGFSSTLSAALFVSMASAAPSTRLSTREFRTPTFVVTLREDTQTLAGLSPIVDRDFDFLPRSLEENRAGNGFAHLGDLHLRPCIPSLDSVSVPLLQIILMIYLDLKSFFSIYL